MLKSMFNVDVSVVLRCPEGVPNVGSRGVQVGRRASASAGYFGIVRLACLSRYHLSPTLMNVLR